MMTATEEPRRRRTSFRSVWVSVAFALALTLLIVAFVGQPSSRSMSPTLQPGDRLIVNRFAYVAADPAPGDIVIFRPDESWGNPSAAPRNWLSAALHWVGETTGIRPYVLVKRVVAGPGQTVACCDADGAVVVDGEPIDEPYVIENLPDMSGKLDCTTSPSSSRCFPEVTVPDGAYLVLGDNRANSADSAFPCRGDTAVGTECYRWMTRDEVFGKAGAILWPIGRWGGP